MTEQSDPTRPIRRGITSAAAEQGSSAALKRGDPIWLIFFAAAGLALASIWTSEPLRELSMDYRYRFGFLAFAVMGTMGQTLAARFTIGRYPAPLVLAATVIMWGLYGMSMGLLIWLVNAGVVMLQAVNLLPGGGLSLSGNPFIGILSSMYFTEPLFTSIFLNLGAMHPLLAVIHLGGKATELARAEGRRPGLNRVACAVDWADFIRREVHAIPMFRIPLLTVVFMLPQDYWLPAAALATAVLVVLEGLVLRPPAAPEVDDASQTK